MAERVIRVLKPLYLVMIDHDIAAADAFRKATMDAMPTSRFEHLISSRSGLRFLLSADPLPDCVIIATGLPGLSGTELTMLIRSQQRLRRLPIVLASPAGLPPDPDASYAARASVHISKSEDYRDVKQTARGLLSWLSMNRLPPKVEVRSTTS